MYLHRIYMHIHRQFKTNWGKFLVFNPNEGLYLTNSLSLTEQI